MYVSESGTRRYVVPDKETLDNLLNGEENNFKFGDKFYIISSKKTKIIDENGELADYVEEENI